MLIIHCFIESRHLPLLVLINWFIMVNNGEISDTVLLFKSRQIVACFPENLIMFVFFYVFFKEKKSYFVDVVLNRIYQSPVLVPSFEL